MWSLAYLNFEGSYSPSLSLQATCPRTIPLFYVKHKGKVKHYMKTMVLWVQILLTVYVKAKTKGDCPSPQNLVQ